MTDVKCHFCNQGADSIIHIYTQCTVVAAARCQFFCLSTKHQCTVPHPHLEQNINQCEISDFPFTHTLLSSTPSHLISPTLAFNMAVWNFRLPASASKFERSPEWIISKIVSIGCLISSPPKKTQHKPSHPRSHENIVKGLPADSIVCYTDGSASPNPGPCGAGILIFDLANQMRYEGGLSLGMGTNNIGELAALGGCAKWTLSLAEHREVHIFTDSELVIKTMVSKRSPKKNSALILAVRDTLKRARDSHSVTIHWVKGHSDVAGNSRVDHLAKKYASPSGQTLDKKDMNFHTNFTQNHFPHMNLNSILLPLSP